MHSIDKNEKAAPELFRAFFTQATQNPEPLPYQECLATADHLPALLNVPTGLGKTAAAILGWIWRRRFAMESIRNSTPRRLVYCLPMRVLVEQTFGEAVKWLDRLGLLAGEAKWTETDEDGLPNKLSRLLQSEDSRQRGYIGTSETGEIPKGWGALNGQNGQHRIGVHLLLGGEDRTDWALWPDRDAILIGTQDMLLSRALNRGYAAGRARWPMEFGLLNADCLWVFDEIQLMDTGLATSLQLDAWRQSLPKGCSSQCASLWMSATMARHWLEKAIDWLPHAENTWKNRKELSPKDDANARVAGLFENKKLLKPTGVKLAKPKSKDNKAEAQQKQADYLAAVGKHICENYSKDGLTLVIVNTVDRATGLFELLKSKENLPETNLIHSRFRNLEREQWTQILSQNEIPRILISTQVVEAGIDLSAKVLYTELAPWASLVQRFGRCARYPNQDGTVFWLDMDSESEKHWARPYGTEELRAARQQLKSFSDVGLKPLSHNPNDAAPESLFPYEPRFVPRRKDLFDLFDTTPDLTGADVDVSRFIRDGEELDVQIFWREISSDQPQKGDVPDRRELCPVPFHRFRESVAKLLKNRKIWRRNYRKGWELLTFREADSVYPGQLYLLEKSCGGYSTKKGWTGNPRDTDFHLPTPVPPAKETLQDDEDDSDELSRLSQPDKWLNIYAHTVDVCRKLDEILANTAVTAEEEKLLSLAARWHDRGKAHIGFQSKLKIELLETPEVKEKLDGEPAAKAPTGAWKKERRIGFRHELASALALLETLYASEPDHATFAWPEGLNKSDFGTINKPPTCSTAADDELVQELADLSSAEIDLLLYLVASHHGKVRMSIRSSPDDNDNSGGSKQARGASDNDGLQTCRLPNSALDGAISAPTVNLHLDIMDLGLSNRYGASWRERTESLLKRMGPFKLAYQEALLRAADCRASAEEDQKADMPKEKA